MANFTVKDIPLLKTHAPKRYKTLTDDTRAKVVALLESVVDDEVDADIKTKIAAADTLRKIDALELKHEETYTPKVDMSVDNLTDEELENQLKLLESNIREAKQLDGEALIKDISHKARVQEQKDILKGLPVEDEAEEAYDPGKESIRAGSYNRSFKYKQRTNR